MMFDVTTVAGDSEVVAIAGDWHGNTGWAMRNIRALAKENFRVIYQLGDFGLWGGHDGASYLRKVNKVLAHAGMLLIVTPGNHENYTMLKKFPLNEYGFQVRASEPNIWYAPRGNVWSHGGVVIASLGGAVSSDSDLRKPGRSWWPEEATTTEDVETLRFNLDSLGVDRVDIMFTHEAPAGVSLASRYASLPLEIDSNINRQRVLIREGMDIAAPRTLFHGHHHTNNDEIMECVNTRGDEYAVRVIGLDMDGHEGNFAFLNMRTGGVVRKAAG